MLAHDLAHGQDTPLRPRAPREVLEETLDLEESASGEQLERALGLLVDRLLARPDRRGRVLRAAVLSARLVEGGTWRERVVFRESTADPLRMRLVLTARLRLLPAPAESLRLTAEQLGAPRADGPALFEADAVRRADRLRRRSARRAPPPGPRPRCGCSPIDPDSRVPERRAVLTPFEG